MLHVGLIIFLHIYIYVYIFIVLSRTNPYLCTYVYCIHTYIYIYVYTYVYIYMSKHAIDIECQYYIDQYYRNMIFNILDISKTISARLSHVLLSWVSVGATLNRVSSVQNPSVIPFNPGSFFFKKIPVPVYKRQYSPNRGYNHHRDSHNGS